MEIKISIKKTTRYLFTTIASLIILHLVFQILNLTQNQNVLLNIIDRFNVDNETSIPTWFAQIQLFTCSSLLALIYVKNKQNNDPHSKYWFWLSIIFLYLSIDEGAAIHETLIDPMKKLFNISSGFLEFAWIIPFSALFLIIAIKYFSFLKQLNTQFQNLFILSGSIYLLGALIFEMFGGKMLEIEKTRAFYPFCIAFEEALEMIGLTVFIYTLLLYIYQKTNKSVTLIVEK